MSSEIQDNSLSKRGVDEIFLKDTYTKTASRSPIRRAKSLGSWGDIGSKQSDFQKNSSRVRIVWRRSSTIGLENLNKVLGIQSNVIRRTRSPSPKPTSATLVDDVFSENFNPLSVIKRTPLAETSHSCTIPITTSINNAKGREKETQRELHFKNINMPSVKSLKSFFEKIGKSSETSKKNTNQKRSLTLTGCEFYPRSDISTPLQKKDLNTSENSNENEATTYEQKFKQEKDDSRVEDKLSVKPTPPESKDEKEVKENVSLQYSQNIDVAHVESVTNLKNIFERCHSVPANLNKINIQKVENKNSKIIIEAEDSNVDISVPMSSSPPPTKTTQNFPDTNESKIAKEISEIKNEATESVSKLKQKWESIFAISFRKEKSFKEVKKVYENPELQQNKKVGESHVGNTAKEPCTAKKVDEISSADNYEAPPSLKVISKLDESENLKNYLPTEDESLTVTHSQNTDELLSAEDHLKRSNSFRSSVIDIAQMYEKRNNFKEKCPSAPSTPTILKKINPDKDAVNEPVTPLTSLQVNRYQPSKSLENFKNKFDFESKEKHKSSVERLDDEKFSSTNKSSSMDEISIASLKRKGSVKNLKKLYENLQNKTCTINSNVNKNLTDSSIQTKDCNNAFVHEENNIAKDKYDNNKNSKYIAEEASDNKSNITESLKSENAEVEIHVNDGTVDVNISQNNIDDKNCNLKVQEIEDNAHKVEDLVKELVESESLSNELLQIPKEKCLTPPSNFVNNPLNVSDVSHLMKARDIFPYANPSPQDVSSQQTSEISSRDEVILPHSSEPNKDGNHVADALPSIPKQFSIDQSDQTLVRNGSRKLKPDELKFFQSLAGAKKEQEEEAVASLRRPRALSIESSSPSSTLSAGILAKSKLRSSSRHFRELHTDELKFFGTSMNGTTSVKHLQSATEMSLRQKTLEQTVTSLSVDDKYEKNK